MGRMAVALISFPRIMDGVLYHQFFATRRPLLHRKLRYRRLNWVNSFFLIAQLFFYYTCVYINSIEHIGEFCISGQK